MGTSILEQVRRDGRTEGRRSAEEHYAQLLLMQRDEADRVLRERAAEGRGSAWRRGFVSGVLASCVIASSMALVMGGLV